MRFILTTIFLLIVQITPLQAEESFTFVVFGATGDLTARKLMPAVYQLAYEGNISQNVAFVGFARANLGNDFFREKMGSALDLYARNKGKEPLFWNKFQNQIFYHQSEFENDAGYEKLGELLAKLDRELGTSGNRIFYLATHPRYFPMILEKLHRHHLIHPTHEGSSWTRVMIEKPFGSDLPSAIELQKQIVKYVAEPQIYRMDHYLGKEGVQNFLHFRFDNALLEPMWNHDYIDHVQITLAEEIGIGSRGRFWEETGSLRDIFQNHILQLIAMVAMEPPKRGIPHAMPMERARLLNAIRPIPLGEIDQYMIRGQYGPGIIKEEKVPGYREEKGVTETSAAETFVAAKLFIDNPRWEGVPFYIRGGKRLGKQATEILVVFKKSGALLIRIQPNAGIFFKTFSKVPGLNKTEMPILFGYQPEKIFNKPSPEAYEKLIFACSQGDHSHFVEAEEQFAAWRLLTPVLEYWKKNLPVYFPNYDSGSWGPKAADLLLEQGGHQWEDNGSYTSI